MIEIAETEHPPGCHHIAFVHPQPGGRGEHQPDQGCPGDQPRRLEKASWSAAASVAFRPSPPPEVIDWIDDGDTPLCPHCGIAAVLPGVTDLVELFRLRERRFGPMRRAAAG